LSIQWLETTKRTKKNLQNQTGEVTKSIISTLMEQYYYSLSVDSTKLVTRNDPTIVKQGMVIILMYGQP